MKKIQLIYFLLSTMLVISLTTCDQMCIEGNGNIRSEYRVVAEFYGVTNSTEYNVKITYDTVYSVRVDADENLMETINTAIRGDNLVIESDKNHCVNSNKDILIDIHMPTLDNIELTGSGSVNVYDFTSSRLTATNTGSGDIDIRNLISGSINFVISGSGNVTVYGTANKANYVISGSGEIYANDFKVGECYITSSGSGDIYCYVLNLLNIVLSGSGDVIYSGSPVITKSDSGSGDIFKK